MSSLTLERSCGCDVRQFSSLGTGEHIKHQFKAGKARQVRDQGW